MSDFYSTYNSRPTNNNLILILVIIFILFASSASISYWKWDDILSLFEDDSTTPSASSSESASQESTSSESASQESTSSESASQESTSSESASQESTSSESASREAISTIQWNDGTRNIGETCNIDSDCRSSVPYPLVCTEDQSTNVKTCKKPPVVNPKTSNCYTYQCNLRLLNNLRSPKYQGLGDETGSYNNPCYKCTYRNWYHPGEHSTYAKKYKIGGGGYIPLPTYTNTSTINYEALYERVCHKNEKNECDPMYSPPSVQ